MDTLDEGAESRNVGGIAKKTTKRLVVEAPTKNALATPGRESERKRGEGEGERTRKVETTCRNNVRVFDLRHVTEPH